MDIKTDWQRWSLCERVRSATARQTPDRKYRRRRWCQFWQRKRAEAGHEADAAEEVARRLEEQRKPTTEAALDHFSRNRPV